MGAITTALLKVEKLPDATVLHLGTPFLYTLWRDLWTCSLTEPVLRHTPTLAGLSVGSRSYRVMPGSFFRVRDFRPFMSASWPQPMQLVLCIPERAVQIPPREVRITVSRDEKFISQVEQEMTAALSRWFR